MILSSMCNGDPPPPGFNDLLGVFLPKGSTDEDTAKSAKRTADNTRPLGLKNTDNKTVAAVANRSITPTIAANADNSQNGFVIRRQGIDNVAVLDAQSRIQDHIAGANPALTTENLPIMPLYDFCAAFPSVAHEFIFIVLTALKIPQGLFLFLKSLYENIRCVGCFDGVSIFLYLIQSGIIQGCPASGSVFVLVVDGFLKLLNTIEKEATTRAFADDIGSVIPALHMLPKYYRAFNVFERISGLGLKATKMCHHPPWQKTHSRTH